MQLNVYQTLAMSTCKESSKNLEYMAYGLSSEVGEVLGKLKKTIRDGNYNEEALKSELGDVLWYVAGFCQVMGWNIGEVAQMNIDKLSDRKERDVIGGSGDER